MNLSPDLPGHGDGTSRTRISIGPSNDDSISQTAPKLTRKQRRYRRHHSPISDGTNTANRSFSGITPANFKFSVTHWRRADTEFRPNFQHTGGHSKHTTVNAAPRPKFKRLAPRRSTSRMLVPLRTPCLTFQRFHRHIVALHGDGTVAQHADASTQGHPFRDGATETTREQRRARAHSCSQSAMGRTRPTSFPPRTTRWPISSSLRRGICGV